MDLSWSPDHKADATNILKNLQLELKKNVNILTTNVQQLDNVTGALSEGKATFHQILCETCKTAVNSKYRELHSEQEPSHKKKTYKMLPPERQKIVNEITKIFMQLERSQTDDQGDEEYCTQEEYHAQQVLALEDTFKKELTDKQTEVADLKKQVKKLMSERDENNKKIKSMSGKLTSTGKFERELRRFQTENKRLQADLESSERRNEQLRKDVESSKEDMRKQRKLLNEERTRRETEDTTDGNIRSLHNDLYTANVEVVRSENEIDGNTKDRAKVQATESHTGQDTSGLLHRSKDDTLSSSAGLRQDIGEVESIQDEIERLKKIERGAIIVQKENDEYIRDAVQLHTERKVHKDKYDSLQRTNEEMVLVMKDLQRDNDRLTRELDEHTSDLVKMRKGDRYESDQNEKYARELAKLQRERQTLQEEIVDSLHRANRDSSSAMKDLQRDNEELTDELGIKEQETHEMKTALVDIHLQDRKSIVMRLRRGNRSGIDRYMVDVVFKELTRTLKERFNSENIDLSIVLSNTPTKVGTGPSFVLCMNTYVQGALGSIKDDRDTYILALHHIDEENMSLLTPTSNSVTGSGLQKLGGILDMAFSCDNVLYECDLNKTAVDKIVTVLKQ